MAEIILHHYPESLFSEKARAILNAKGLAWRSVIIPMIMPRPDTIPLTGGYRRTPVMQIGADIYCDTAIIAAVLDDKGKGPTLYPAGSRLAAQTLARWVDTELFWASVTLKFLPENMGDFFANSDGAQAFAADRANFSQGSTIRSTPLDESRARYLTFLDELQAQLGDGRAFLFGADWSIADFSTYHVLWFLHQNGGMADVLNARPSVAAWFGRMRALGAGSGVDMSGPEALDVARAAEPEALEPFSDLVDIKPGETVDVAPVDYGVMPSRGALVRCDRSSIIIRRAHERVGTVQVHFPRHGFAAVRAS
jgi:glutathione S-transferase